MAFDATLIREVCGVLARIGHTIIADGMSVKAGATMAEGFTAHEVYGNGVVALVLLSNDGADDGASRDAIIQILEIDGATLTLTYEMGLYMSDEELGIRGSGNSKPNDHFDRMGDVDADGYYTSDVGGVTIVTHTGPIIIPFSNLGTWEELHR